MLGEALALRLRPESHGTLCANCCASVELFGRERFKLHDKAIINSSMFLHG